MAAAPVPIFPVGPAAVATVLFRENGVVHVVAIVKATFTFSYQGPMQPGRPDPIVTAEVHRLNNPTRSIVATSDLAPRIPAVDVILLGQAHAPGEGATHARARLAVGRGKDVLLDKVVHVVGDRKGNTVKPFRSMPLVYEKAFGGPGFRDNPIGTGVLSDDPPPNLVDPAVRERVVGFGPISRSWSARQSLLPPEGRAALEKPIAEIPPGFDFRYFHAAPPDQRPAYLLGDEWILLEGVHPERPQIQLQLPGAQALVRVVGTEADGRVFSLRADTLRIDAEAERCTLVWRNAFPVRERDLGEVRLLAGVALPGAPVEWPARAPDVAPAQRVVPAARPAGLSGTMLLEDGPTAAANFGGTMELGDSDFEAVSIDVSDLAGSVVLAGTRAPETVPLPAVRRRPDPSELTIELSGDAPPFRRETMPFAVPFAGDIAAPRPSGPIPGSPFGAPAGAPEPFTPSVPAQPRPPSNEISVTLDELEIEGDAELDLSSTLASSPVSPPPAPEPSPVAVSAPAPVPPSPVAAVSAPAPAPPSPAVHVSSPGADPYGQSLREAPPPPAAPAPKRTEAPPNVRSNLYKGFRR